MAEGVGDHGGDRHAAASRCQSRRRSARTVVAPSRRRQKAAKSCSPRQAAPPRSCWAGRAGAGTRAYRGAAADPRGPDRRRPGRSSAAIGRRTARRSRWARDQRAYPDIGRKHPGQPGAARSAVRGPGARGHVGVDHLAARVHPGVGAPGHGQPAPPAAAAPGRAPRPAASSTVRRRAGRPSRRIRTRRKKVNPEPNGQWSSLQGKLDPARGQPVTGELAHPRRAGHHERSSLRHLASSPTRRGSPPRARRPRPRLPPCWRLASSSEDSLDVLVLDILTSSSWISSPSSPSVSGSGRVRRGLGSWILLGNRRGHGSDSAAERRVRRRGLVAPARRGPAR